MTKINIISLILGLIIFGGSFLRFYQLDQQSYWMDEGYTINAVISGATNGYIHGASLLDSGEKYFCPLYCYPTAKITQIIGHNAFAYRFLSALFGSFFILFIYFFTKTIFKNEKIAVLSTFFTAFSYWQIAWSRQARWYTMLEVFFWLSLLFFYLYLKSSKKKTKINYFILSFFFTTIAIATHALAYLLPIVMFIWYIIEKRPNFKKNILAVFVTAVMLIIAEFGTGRHFISHTLQNISLNYNIPYYLNFYLRNYWPFIIIGSLGYFQANKERQKKFLMLLAPFLLYLLSLSIFSNIIHYRYLFHTNVAFYIISVAISIDIFEKIRHIILKTIFAFLLILVFFFSGAGVITPPDFYFLEADNPNQLKRPYYGYTPQPDFNLAYAKVKENLKSDEVVISSHPHFNKIFLNQAGYWLRYNYLGMEYTDKTIKENKEYYVNAKVINNLVELKNITETKHGYIVFDYMTTDGRLSPELINYIQTNLKLFFFNEKNSYSKIWIYHF